MKRHTIIFSLLSIFFLTCFCAEHEQSFMEEEKIVDTIVSIVSCPAGTELITQSDLNRPTIFGKFRTIEECELEKAILLDAKQHQIHVDDEMVESYFESIQKAYNITRDQVQQMFIDAGYTINEGIEQLRNSQIANIVLQREVYERISVTLQEAEQYYHNHPEFRPATYTVQRATLENLDHTIDINRIRINQFQFSPPISLERSEISPEHLFVLNLEPGEVHVEEKEHEIEAIKLLSKTVEEEIPFEQRYNDIINILRQEKFEFYFNQYKEKVLKSVSIIRM